MSTSVVMGRGDGLVAPGEPSTAARQVSRRRRWWLNPSAMIGAGIAIFVTLLALVSRVWTPYNPIGVAPALALHGSSGAHLLGTDQYGRDVLSRVMAGGWITLYSAFVSVALALAVGAPVGVLAAVRRGWVGETTMRVVDVIYAFPALLAAITLSAALGASTSVAMVGIGVAYIPVVARITRSSAIAVLSSEYVLAARAYGRRPLAIVRRHVLPNIAPVLLVQATLLFSLAILAEAAVDYLGLGTPPPTASWGQMLAAGQNYLAQDPILELWPGLAVFVTVMGFNLLGDGLRGLIDPRLRR
jgi:peptide/nickel transport system permease protein